MLKNKKQALFRTAGTLLGAGAVFFVVSALTAHAGPSLDFPTNFADFATFDLKKAIENIVRIVLGFVGILFLLLLLYGGLLWMTSRGDEKKITQAKKIIASAVIGLLITLGSYAIAGFIIRSFGGAVGSGGSSSSSGPPGGSLPGGYALGAGVLESHYPGRGASGIPRNTNIVVTFKEDIDPTTMCTYTAGRCAIGAAACANNAACGANAPCIGKVIPANVEIKEMTPPDHEPADLNDATNDNILEGVSCSTTNNRTFKFDPPALLGWDQGDTRYQVGLKSGVTKQNGDPAFGALGSYYWQFIVSNIVDTTPPKVTSIVPFDSGTNIAPNILVQINFSEPVDPGSVSGVWNSSSPLFDNIALKDSAAPPATPFTPAYVEGQYIVANQYTSTEFIPDGDCAGRPTNSCGQRIYCLPAGRHLYLYIKDGVITDMAGNILDAEYNGTSLPSGDGTDGGALGDAPNYYDFFTSNNLDLDPPALFSREPRNNGIDAGVRDPIRLKFNKILSASSVTSLGVGLSKGANDNIAYWVQSTSTQDLNGDSKTDTTITVNHDQYLPLTVYHPGANSRIRDVYQNCYYPASCDTNGNGLMDDDNAAPFGTIDQADCIGATF